MSECSHDCSSCNKDCSSKSMIEKPHELSRVKKVIGVVSGKGGVGKSMVTSTLAVTLNRRGNKVGIMDADITGPSIPKMFGLGGKLDGDNTGLYPAQTKKGIKVVSVNLLLDDPTAPVVWRGPVIAGMVKQFWTDVIWGDLDFLFVDMPPGTGDVPLTVFQSLPIDGIVIVTSPQELVSMIVEKAVNMAKLMNVPILGLVENLSYVECPACKEKIYPFGEGKAKDTAEKFGIASVAELPIKKDYAQQSDKGLIELFEGNELDSIADVIENIK
ncbi:MAG: P-loop NTPase [Christensenellales bacterium]